MTAMPATDQRPMLFVTSWCPYCAKLKAGLDRAGIAYDETDVEADDRAAAFVTGVNGGNRVVPTVLFPDGTTATNPPASLVADRLAATAS